MPIAHCVTVALSVLNKTMDMRTTRIKRVVNSLKFFGPQLFKNVFIPLRSKLTLQLGFARTLRTLSRG